LARRKDNVSIAADSKSGGTEQGARSNQRVAEIASFLIEDLEEQLAK